MMLNSKFGDLKYDKTPIRMLFSEQGSIEWVCLNDILKSLSRKEMIDNGRITKICRSVQRISFKEGGRNRWGIKPHDIHYLLREIAPDSKMASSKCDKMQEWINSLPIQMQQNVKVSLPTPTREPVIFNYQDKFPITFKAENGKTFVNATQMSKSFNKYPFVWLNLAATIEFREAMVRRGESESLESQIMSTRGSNGATWIEESLAMELARWLSPDFSAWCNHRIQDLVTKGYVEMQPKPREYRDSFDESVGNLPVPQNFDEALQLAADQAKRIREDAHKVTFYDDYVENRDCFKSTRIADELEISVIQLHRFLAENEIVKYENRCWVVHPPYRPLQCEVPYMWERPNGKFYPFGSVKRWTQAGREYIIDLWYANNPWLISK